MTTNESLKHWLATFSMKLGEDNCSAKATNYEQVWKHKSWKDKSYKHEINPQIPLKAKK